MKKRKRKKRKSRIIFVSPEVGGGFGYPTTPESIWIIFYLLFSLPKLQTSQDFPNFKVTLELSLYSYPYIWLFYVNWIHSDSKWTGMIPVQPSIKLQEHLNSTWDAFWFILLIYLAQISLHTAPHAMLLLKMPKGNTGCTSALAT